MKKGYTPTIKQLLEPAIPADVTENSMRGFINSRLHKVIYPTMLVRTVDMLAKKGINHISAEDASLTALHATRGFGQEHPSPFWTTWEKGNNRDIMTNFKWLRLHETSEPLAGSLPTVNVNLKHNGINHTFTFAPVCTIHQATEVATALDNCLAIKFPKYFLSQYDEMHIVTVSSCRSSCREGEQIPNPDHISDMIEREQPFSLLAISDVTPPNDEHPPFWHISEHEGHAITGKKPTEIHTRAAHTYANYLFDNGIRPTPQRQNLHAGRLSSCLKTLPSLSAVSRLAGFNLAIPQAREHFLRCMVAGMPKPAYDLLNIPYRGLGMMGVDKYIHHAMASASTYDTLEL